MLCLVVALARWRMLCTVPDIGFGLVEDALYSVTGFGLVEDVLCWAWHWLWPGR